MKKSLDHESFIPLYHQLKEIIEEKIGSSDWKTGDKILSENELRKMYNISRNTVQKALDELVQEGILQRQQGKGTFVSKPKIEQPLTGFYSFSKVIANQGMEAKDVILDLEIKSAEYKIANKLQISQGEEVIALQRLRSANDEPVILETSYLPKSIVTELSREDLAKFSLYDLLEEKFGVIVIKAKETFEPVLIRPYEEEFLGVKAGTPGLLLDRIAYDKDGRIVEYCRSIVRGDRCRFYTELL